VTIDADGQGTAVTLLESPNRLYPAAWSPDGRSLVYEEQRPDTGWDIYALETEASGLPAGEPEPLIASPANETNAELSTDGRFLAYESDEQEGLVEIYVRPFGRAGAKVKVSTGGARWPNWHDRGELFYWSTSQQQMYRVPYRVDGGSFVVAGHELVWSAADSSKEVPLSEFLGRGFDLDPKRLRFLTLESAAATSRPGPLRIVLAPGWAWELAGRQSAGR
jgi:hypothetical protein